MKPFFVCLRAIVRPIVWLLFPYRVYGKQFVSQSEGCVLCCNHISLMDAVFLLVAQKRPICFMAKSELFSHRLLAALLRGYGAFPVRRGTGDTSAVDTAVALAREGKVIGIFPEGTRSKNGKLGIGKSGAALIVQQAQVPVLPAAIRTKHQKVRPFRRVELRFGEPFSLPETQAGEERSSSHLRSASRTIMGQIAALLDQEDTPS